MSFAACLVPLREQSAAGSWLVTAACTRSPQVVCRLAITADPRRAVGNCGGRDSRFALTSEMPAPSELTGSEFRNAVIGCHERLKNGLGGGRLLRVRQCRPRRLLIAGVGSWRESAPSCWTASASSATSPSMKGKQSSLERRRTVSLSDSFAATRLEACTHKSRLFGNRWLMIAVDTVITVNGIFD